LNSHDFIHCSNAQNDMFSMRDKRKTNHIFRFLLRLMELNNQIDELLIDIIIVIENTTSSTNFMICELIFIV
jgi:hypothetical protein